MDRSPSWVIDSALARSSRPGYPLKDVGPEEVDRWLDKVRCMGVKSIICLLADEELAYYRMLPDGLLGTYQRAGFEVSYIPITDPAHDPVGQQELEENLERIFMEFQRLPKPVLVHCSAGVDRTGRVVQYIQKRLQIGES